MKIIGADETQREAVLRRKHTRLKDYDYSLAGGYFITICTKNREYLFGKIENDSVSVSHYGEIVRTCWKELADHYPNLQLDQFVVMPNHVHGIILLLDELTVAATSCRPNDSAVGAGFKPAPTRRYPLSEILRAFKTFSARRINEYRRTPGLSLWQRNYYEHIIRNQESLNKIREYILTNPVRWKYDRENPQQLGSDEFDAWLDSQGQLTLKRKDLAK
jgi:putative transposase